MFPLIFFGFVASYTELVALRGSAGSIDGSPLNECSTKFQRSKLTTDYTQIVTDGGHGSELVSKELHDSFLS